jgi:ketosteroid isomerase-like protein
LSAQNVEIVRRSMEAFARGELDAFVAELDPRVEWTTASDEPNPQTFHGHDGVRRFASEIAEAWSGRFDDVMRFDDFLDLGDWVVVPWNARLRGRASGIEVDVSETYAVQVRDFRILRVDEYRTSGEAIDAVVPGDR